MSYRTIIGERSGVPIVTVDIQSPVLPDDNCPACGSIAIRKMREILQVVDFLEPVHGEPYPTLAVTELEHQDFICRQCGAHWGADQMHHDRVPEAEIAYDVYTRKPINDPEAYGY